MLFMTVRQGVRGGSGLLRWLRLTTQMRQLPSLTGRNMTAVIWSLTRPARVKSAQAEEVVDIAAAVAEAVAAAVMPEAAAVMAATTAGNRELKSYKVKK